MCVPQGPEEFPMFWFHLPNIGAVSYTSNRPQNDIGSYLAFCIVGNELVGQPAGFVPACVCTHRDALRLTKVPCEHAAVQLSTDGADKESSLQRSIL